MSWLEVDVLEESSLLGVPDFELIRLEMTDDWRLAVNTKIQRSITQWEQLGKEEWLEDFSKVIHSCEESNKNNVPDRKDQIVVFPPNGVKAKDLWKDRRRLASKDFIRERIIFVPSRCAESSLGPKSTYVASKTKWILLIDVKAQYSLGGAS
jgi:hypothetical protein